MRVPAGLVLALWLKRLATSASSTRPRSACTTSRALVVHAHPRGLPTNGACGRGYRSRARVCGSQLVGTGQARGARGLLQYRQRAQPISVHEHSSQDESEERRRTLDWDDVSPRAIERPRMTVDRVNWFSIITSRCDRSFGGALAEQAGPPPSSPAFPPPRASIEVGPNHSARCSGSTIADQTTAIG